MKKKSQSSLEFLLIFGIGFFLILLMGGVFFTFSSEAKQNLDRKQLTKISNDIMTNIENVYFLGNGNRITMDVNMPEGIENITIHHYNVSGDSYDYLNFSFYLNQKFVSEIIIPKETYIKFDCSDCSKLNENLSYFPIYDINPGPKRIRFESKGDYVDVNFIRE